MLELCHTSLSQIGKKLNTLDLSIYINLSPKLRDIMNEAGAFGVSQELQHHAIFPAQKDDG
jgi:hypothetical protein